MHPNTISRTAFKAWLQGLRLPIAGVEFLAGQRSNGAWPPALLFETFEADAKQLVGSMLRDDNLVDEGRVQQAKVAELRRASELEVQAEQKRAVADNELQARRRQVEQQRHDSEQRARAQKEEVERDKRAAQQRTNRQLDNKAKAIKKTAQRRNKRVAATDRKARLTAVERESTAVRRQRRAATATKTATKTANALERKQSQRRNGAAKR